MEYSASDIARTVPLSRSRYGPLPNQGGWSVVKPRARRGSERMRRWLPSRTASGRDRLVTTLVERFDLLAVAAQAARDAGIPEREEQVAYCLVVLTDKADPVRSSSALRADRRAPTTSISRPTTSPSGSPLGTHDRGPPARLGGGVRGDPRRFRPLRDHDAARSHPPEHRRRRHRRDRRQARRGPHRRSAPRGHDDRAGARDRTRSAQSTSFRPRFGAGSGRARSGRCPGTPIPIGPREEETAARAAWTSAASSSARLDLREELDLDAYRELVDRVAGLADTQSLLPEAVARADRLDRDATRSRLASAADISAVRAPARRARPRQRRAAQRAARVRRDARLHRARDARRRPGCRA